MSDPRPAVPFAEVPPARRLEQLWQQGRRPDVHQFLSGVGIKAIDELAAVLVVDQWQRWRSGERVLAETYLERYSALADDAGAALDLIFGEVLVREELGEIPGPAEYLRRFPRWAPQLRQQFDVHEALERARSSRPASLPVSPSELRLTQGENPAQPFPGGPRLPALPGYEVLGEIGRGAMGVVYKARQLRLNRVVALKMVLAGAQAGPAARVRFLREAELAARLRHPNVVPVYEIDAHEGRLFFTQEYLEGGSLATRLNGKPLPPAEAAALIEQIAAGVHHAHEHGVVHRDLKPGNVLLTAEGAPKVADFGLARWTDLGPGLTLSGAIVGTASYMAPEQAAGKSHEVGPAADVYALGAILYELVTGRPPFLGQSTFDTLAQVQTLDPVPPRRLRPKTPRDLEIICLQCLQKDPRRRYASALALAEDLRRFLRNEPIVAQPASALYRLRKFTQRQKVLVGGAMVVFAALVVGLVGATLGTTRAWRAEGETRAESERASLAERKVQAGLAEPHVHAGKLDAEELELERSILADWERLAPADPVLLHLRVEVEFRAGNDQGTIATADRLLALHLDDPKAKEWQAQAKERKAQAIERLRQKVQTLPPE